MERRGERPRARIHMLDGRACARTRYQHFEVLNMNIYVRDHLSFAENCATTVRALWTLVGRCCVLSALQCSGCVPGARRSRECQLPSAWCPCGLGNGLGRSKDRVMWGRCDFSSVRADGSPHSRSGPVGIRRMCLPVQVAVQPGIVVLRALVTSDTSAS